MSGAEERLAAVRRYTDLGAPVDGAFHRVTRMAAKIFATPMATVSIVDEDRVWFLAATGLDGSTLVGTEPGLCVSAILGSEPYVVLNAVTDPRTADHPLVVGDLAVRFTLQPPSSPPRGMLSEPSTCSIPNATVASPSPRPAFSLIWRNRSRTSWRSGCRR